MSPPTTLTAPTQVAHGVVGRTGPAWEPLLAGEAAARAEAAIFAIARSLSTPTAAGGPDERPDLARGLAGRALFFHYLAEATGDRSWEEPALVALETALAGLGKWGGPELLGGATGVGWAVDHLAGRLVDPADADEVGDALGAALMEAVGDGWSGTYDLIGGLAGIAVYALEGLPRPSAAALLEASLDALDAAWVELADGVAWPTAPDLLVEHQRRRHPHGEFNLGVGHGVPAVLVVLARAAAAGFADHPAVARLEPATAWLLGREQEADAPARFANWLAADENGLPAPPGRQATRLAWCYGDLGLAAALAAAGAVAGHASWHHTALRVAADATTRVATRSGLEDAGLCHGAAGLAHLFHRLARTAAGTDHAESLAAAARHGVAATLAYRTPGLGIGGFRSWEPTRGGWVGDAGFLCGAAGVGLALLAAVGDGEPAWDRCLAISAGETPVAAETDDGKEER